MKIYTVQMKPGDSGLNAVFVPEGFSVWAFVFLPFWALYHRLWLVAGLICLGLFGLTVLSQALNLSSLQDSLLQVMFALLVGAEARDLWRWTLRRRGFEMRSALAADDEDEAELRFFGTTRAV
ncbi:DUF2628 domain-containing protein [Govanella unica]|uniref:DUF2628 domain-containing protein n=1 Tax=Govanella unica TaxID=2975056 RepID=A0A9X3Z810_9PROT|nr:DUF2628 domain-containing protein [Govania unica]MDA5194598.1 DUF2628 domain-containing protein [Govania unica]